MILNFRTLRKLKIDYKHVRFKSSYKKLETSRSKELRTIRTQKLADVLECNLFTAREITSKNQNIYVLDYNEFHRNAQFCKTHLKISDLVEFPNILSLNSSLLQHRYFALKELGCNNITASAVLKFPFILKKSPKVLRKQGLSFLNHNFDCLKKHLDFSDRAEISGRLQCMYEKDNSLWKIKESMNAEFLIAKLGCSIGKAHEMFNRYPPLRVQSISNTDQLLDVLFKELGFSVSKIFHSLTLLSLHPEIVENFILEMPEMLGIDIITILNKQPQMLRKPISSIQEIESILRDFSITDSQLMCCPKVIAFSPSTLKDRLTFLSKSEDFSLLKSYKKFLWLVYYFNNLDPRIHALKALGIPCSVSMFTVSKSNFNKYLCITESRTHINDTCHYLVKLFGISEKEILVRLKEYPNYQNSSLLNCKKVIEFLLNSDVSKKQIFNGVGIIFYDVDVVMLYFNDLKNHPECQPFEEWIHHYNLIQLLIYVIEVDTGFQGSRLYKVKGKVDESEELLVNYSSN